MKYKLVWFRNDLRLNNNPALYNAAKNKDKSLIKAVFCITIKQWQDKHYLGLNKIGFILRNVFELKKNLSMLNIPLAIIEEDYYSDLPTTLLKFAKQEDCTDIYLNTEYELNEKTRDLKVKELFINSNLGFHEFFDQFIAPPEEIYNKNGNPYVKFTPYKNEWNKLVQRNWIKIYPKPQKQPVKPHIKELKINFSGFTKIMNTYIQEQWPAGETFSKKLLKNFCNSKINDYDKLRDYPEKNNTSRLSPYLAVGSISPQQCFIEAISKNNENFTSGNKGIVAWINEIIWRDFYRYIVYHFPNVCKNKNFNQTFDKVSWRKDKKNLEKWKNGKTGIPIIDAAMRQLLKTGWMHNRLRMIVAMFLTKNLLIDWREGEKHFCEYLIDLDFSSNNGGWQWASSTGTDSVPYFRIFNPVTQSKKFDPEGRFIKKYCPEIISLDKKQIHEPWNYLSKSELKKLKYPYIIIDLKTSRERAIQEFKN